MLDIQIDPKTLPSRLEIRHHGKEFIVSNSNLVELLYKFNNKLIDDCRVWIEGYAVGASYNEFTEPIDNSEVKNFYLDRVNTYIEKRLIE